MFCLTCLDVEIWFVYCIKNIREKMSKKRILVQFELKKVTTTVTTTTLKT